MFVGQRQAEAVAKGDQVGVVELLLLVRGHAALTGVAHAVALFRLRQDHDRLVAVRGGCGIGRMDLHQIMSAALQAVDLLVGQALRECGQRRVLAEKMFAVVAPVLGGEGLELAVHRLGKGARQCAALVARKQAIPIGAPHELDHVPAGPGEQGLEFIDDAAVAAHRAVESLQVAVDDPRQVVQALARSQRERAHALGLVHLAIAEDAPDAAPRGRKQPAVMQVAHEARLVDRADRPDAHRAGRELPEPGHQPGVRVAAQPLRANPHGAELLPVVREILLAQAAFEKGPGVDTRCGMRLVKNEVTAVRVVACAKEVVEADLEQIGRAGVARDVAAQFAMGLVGTHHHRQCVPSHDAGKLLLDGQIAGKRRLLLRCDAVDVGRAVLRAPIDPALTRPLRQLVEHEGDTRRAVRCQQRVQRRLPFGRFLRVDVGVPQLRQLALNRRVAHCQKPGVPGASGRNR